jgi:hypothetical protein
MSKFRLDAAKQRRNLEEGPIIPSSGNLQKTLQANPDQLYLSCKPFFATVVTHSQDASGTIRQLDGGSMREVTRIVATALAAATLSLAAAMPLVAAWRIPAEQSATQASIDAPGQQIQGLPLVF